VEPRLKTRELRETMASRTGEDAENA